MRHAQDDGILECDGHRPPLHWEIMSTRINYLAAAPGAVQALSSVGKYLHAEKFDLKLKALVELRVSQINGCAYCLNLHTQEARALGEKQQRLDCLSAWRETTFY